MPKTDKYNKNYITIYFPDMDELNFIRGLAERAKINPTTYMRSILTKHINKIREEMRIRIAKLQPPQDRQQL